MKINSSKRKLKALEILATVNSHKKMLVYEDFSEQREIVRCLESERDSIENNINAAGIFLDIDASAGGSFCPELYGAKVGYINNLYESKVACDNALTKNNEILFQKRSLLSEVTSRVNLIDEKYMMEKIKYVELVIKQQEAK